MSVYEIETADGSVYEIETQDTDPTVPLSAGETLAGGLQSMLSGLTLGAGDKISAGVNAGIDALTGGPGYDARLAQAKDLEDRYAQEHPYASAVLGIGPSLLMPIPKAVTGAKGLKGVGARLAFGTGTGAAAGALSSDGDLGQALRSAQQGAKSGGLFSAALESILGAGKLTGAVGKAVRNKAMGLTARDYISAAQNMDLGTVGQGKERLLGALQEAESAPVDSGILGGARNVVTSTAGQVNALKPAANLLNSGIDKLGWYAQLIKPTESFLGNAIGRAEQAAEPHAKRVGQIIADADTALNGAQVAPDLPLIQKSLDSLSALDREKVGKKVVDRATAYLDRYQNQGGSTLTNLQAEKVGLNRALENRPFEEEAQNVWRRGVRSAIERKADELANAGLINAAEGELQAENLKYGAAEQLIKGLKKDLPTAQAEDLAEQIRRGLYTTSGLGTQGIRNVAEGFGPLGGILSGLTSAASYFKPVGRVLGQLGKDSGAVLDAIGASPSLRLLAAAAIASAHEDAEGAGQPANPSLQSGIGAPIQADNKNKGRKQNTNDPYQNRGDGLKEGETRQKNDKAKSNGQNSVHGGLFSPASYSSSLFNSGLGGGATQYLFGNGRSNSYGDDMNYDAENLVNAVIQAESAGNPKATSGKGAMGLMQIMPATFKEEAAKLGLENADPYDADTNRQVGTAYLNTLLNRYEDPKLALIAYNWGLGNLDRLIARLNSDDPEKLLKYVPEETRNYVPSVLRNLGVVEV